MLSLTKIITRQVARGGHRFYRTEVAVTSLMRPSGTTVLYDVVASPSDLPFTSIFMKQLVQDVESKATKYFDDNEWYDAMEYDAYRSSGQESPAFK